MHRRVSKLTDSINDETMYSITILLNSTNAQLVTETRAVQSVISAISQTSLPENVAVSVGDLETNGALSVQRVNLNASSTFVITNHNSSL